MATESLAGRLAIHATCCAKAADESTDSVIDIHQMKALAVDLAEAATQLRTAASEGGEELVVGEDGWIDPVTRDNESLVQCALENYARASHYRNIGQHNAAMACKAELLRRLTHPPSVARDGAFMVVHIIEDRRLRPREMMVCTGAQQHRYLIDYGTTPTIKVGPASHDTAISGAAGVGSS